MRVHEQAGLHHPGQTHKLASGHWAPCTTLEGIGLTDLLQTEGLFCSWEACGKQGPTWRTERVGMRLSIIGSLLWFMSSYVTSWLVKRNFQVTPVTSRQFLERGILHVKGACCGLCLIERGILHLKRTGFPDWLMA